MKKNLYKLAKQLNSLIFYYFLCFSYEPNDGAYLDLETLKVEQNYKAREASFWNDLIPRYKTSVKLYLNLMKILSKFYGFRMSITASASSSQPTCDVKSDGQVN